MLLSGDFRRAPPSFSHDSSRVHIAAPGVQGSVIAQVATRTGKIVSVDASAHVTGIVPYRNSMAVSSPSGITVGKKTLTSTSGSQLTTGLNGGLVFKTSRGVHVLRNSDVTDLPLEHRSIIVANGDFAVGASGSQFQVWCDDWDAPIDFTHDQKITALAAGPGVLAVGDSKGIITTWFVLKKSLAKKRQKQESFTAKNHWHANQVIALAFWGNSIISGGEEGVLRVWHLEGHTFQNVPRLGAAILHIVVSPDEQWVAATLKDNSLIILDCGNWQVKRVIAAVEPCSGPRASLPTSGLCFGGNGKLTFVNRPFQAKTVPLWQRNYVAQEGTPWKLVCMSFSRDERTLVTCERMDFQGKSYRQVMKWWTLDNAGYSIDSVVYDAHVGKVTAVVAHPTQAKFFSVCSLGVIKTWEFLEANRRMMWQPTVDGVWRDKPISAADISADGSILCLAYARHIVLWDSASSAYVNSWTHSGETVLDLRFYHPWGGDLLVCALFAHEMKVWNAMGSCPLVQTLAVTSSCINISPSRRLLALASRDVVQVYRLENHKLAIEKEIPCPRIDSTLWVTDDKIALVIGAAIQVTSLSGAAISYEEPQDEIPEKPVAQQKKEVVPAIDNDIHQIVRGAQHVDLLEKLVVPKSSPTHLLPPCRLLLHRHLAAFAKTDAHSVLPKDPATPATRASDSAPLEAEICEELGPILDADMVAKICGGE